MENDLKIDMEELKKIVGAIRQKKNMIIDIYEKQIKKILYKSMQYISDGQNYVEEEKLKALFSKFDNDMTNLEETLVNKIIPIYESLFDDVKGIFNDQFANEMQNLLDLDKK